VRLVVLTTLRNRGDQHDTEGRILDDDECTRQRFFEAAAVKRWGLRSLAPSSRKQRAREPGADAPRVPRSGMQMPRVLFTSPECRSVVIDLRGGERHVVRALADARLWLLLAPWPAAKHNTEATKGHDQHLPVNAVTEPIPWDGTTADTA
jgi:hypothetical protein